MTYTQGIAKFAILMKEQMRANSFKSGWQEITTKEAWDRIIEEVLELGIALRYDNKELIKKEAADVGNFLMMLCLSLEDRKKYKCKGCGYPVQFEGDYCGECMCEEDGI